jgi:type VI secretion system protein ImpG
VSPVNDGIDTYLALTTPRDATPYLGPETISLELTCTNRSLPAQLRIGYLNVATASSPTVARFSNLLPVTKPARPPIGSELHWRLISHLSLGHGSLATANALRSLLGLYNFQARGDYPLARANALRLDSIRDIQSAAARRFIQGAPVRGQRTMLELDEGGFAGVGDLFLFGCILDELFANNLTLNSFNELSVRSFPSRMEYRWPARSGSQPLL